MKKDNIILIGFMGSGKTTFGKWISTNKMYEFCDTDQYIENKENRKIKDIFAAEGEAAFRDMETDTIKELCEVLNHTVVSVGGGLPVREENRELLKRLGKVVYLRTTKETLLKRLKNDTDRPLLAGGNLEKKIDDLMSARENIYIDAADVIVDTDEMSFDQMYELVMEHY